MTEAGVIPHHEDRQLCACGEPIKPCPVPLEPQIPGFCLGYIHVKTAIHGCLGRDGGLARPHEEATVPP